MAISSKPSNILGAGLRKWQRKATNASTGSADDAYYTLPYPFEGKFIDKTLFQGDSRGQEVPHAIDFAYEAKFMCSDKTNLIKLIPALVRNPCDDILTFQNGRTGASANLHTQKMGSNFKLVFDSDMENVRYLQLMTDRKIMVQPITLVGTVTTVDDDTTFTGLGTAFLTALRAGDYVRLSGGTTVQISTIASDTSATLASATGTGAGAAGQTMTINDWLNFLHTVPADGTPDVGDILYLLNSLTRSSIYPGGVRQIQAREISAVSWTHNLGKVNKFKLTIEGLGERDQEGRTQCNRAKFNLSVDMMQSVQTEELVDIQTLARQENEYQIEFVDGLLLNLLNPSNLGIVFELHNDTDATGNQFITLTGSGIISLLGTTFADLWA